MNWQRTAIAVVSLLCLVFGSTDVLKAEGTKQLSPADSNEVMLHTNANGFGNFAEFGANDTSSLFVRITDTTGPTRDTLYIGLSREAMDNGDLETFGLYDFRIVDPAGNVVHGPFTISSMNNNADTWLLASSGPDVLDPIDGYSTNTAMHPFAVFVPDTIGDFRLEFTDGSSGNIVNVKWFDFTVVNSGAEMPGRLWSRNWALRTPPSNGNMPPECQFNQAFEGTLFSYTMDGFVSRIDFDSSGFQGLSFTVAFGLTGPGNTGDIIADRMSVNNMNATSGAADHMVFVQEPDIIEFPSPANPCGTAEILGLECIGDSICILVGVTRMGQVEILLDFANNNQLYDPDTTDVLLAMQFTQADTACLYWDGLMGDGTPVDFGMMVPTYLRYAQGVQHYAAFDVELLKNGWCVETVRPLCPGVSTDLLYWDDSNITDDLVTTTIDEGDPGTGQPKVQLNGCVCGTGGCRTWTNFQIGDPPSGTCTGTPIGYGEQSTLNTWWFASTTFEGPITLPFVGVVITGDSTICVGDSTVFTAEGTPDTIPYQYNWDGPGGFMATTMTTGFVSTPGIYRVTITDTVANCSAIDSITLVELALPTTSITTSCPMSNTPNGDIDLTVSGSGPFTYMWSNGAMTEDLTDVPPGTYDVMVTDMNGCMAFDTVTLDPCCTLMFSCPPMSGGTFSCITDVPAPDTTLITVTDFCAPLTISSMDTSNVASGCVGDPILVTRTYLITDGAGSTGTCQQTFTVQDDIAPALIECPSDTTILCNTSTDTTDLGVPVYMDACDGAIVTFSDMMTGFDGSCSANIIGVITRSFFGTDACGNTNTACQQTITVIDTVAPAFTAPPDVTIDCLADISPSNTGEVADSTDNCSAMTVSFSDVSAMGSCPVIEVITRTWVVTDACGNSTSDVQTISLEDTAAPTFTVPPDVTIACAADSSPVFTGEILDTLDNCSSITVMFIDNVVLDGCPETDTIFRTWIVSDFCGNSATGVQTIVRVDNEAPTFTVPADVTIECTQDSLPATTGDVNDLMDNCSTPTIVFVDNITSGPCDGIDTIERTWIASDQCGNSSSGIQTIVRIDTVPPTITSCPADVTVNCDASTDPANTGMPTATDNCSGSVAITYSDDAAGGTCDTDPPIMRTWTFTDDCGNSATCVQIITIQDTLAPMLLQGSCPADVTIDCNDSSDPADLGIPMYLDNCSAVTVTVQNDSTGFDGTCASMIIGTITRTFYAEDICGNIDSSCVQTITVQDSEGPTFTVPVDVTIECGQDSLPATTGDVTDAMDNCSNVTVDFSDVVVADGCPAIDTIFRTWTATDACGNMTTGLQTILREDNMAPTFTTPADTAIDCSIAPDPANTGMVMNAIDNCTDVTVTYSDAVSGGVCPVVSTVMRTWVVSDECGNSTSDVQTITLIDTIAPTFTTPADVTISCEDDPTDLGLTGDVTDAADNCSAGVTTDFTDSPNLGCNGTGSILRTWTATDDCGNVSSGVQTITIEDVVPPTALCMDITIDFNLGDVQTITPAEVDGGSFDNCGDVTLSLSQTEFSCLAFVNDSIQTVILTVTDECGLISTCEVQVTGIGGAGLVLNCPTAVVVDLDPGACSGIANYEVSVSPLCGSLDNVTIQQVDNSGLTSGDYFPIGTTIQEYIAFTPFGDTASCSFPVIVVEHAQEPWVACNDTVTISADQNCQVFINPDVILEGGVYGCFDDFIITVEGFGSAGGEIVLTDPELGVYYNVTITTEDGLSCWGKIVVEDKIPPMLTCTDVTLECGDDTDPVFTDVVSGNLSSSAFPASPIGPDAGTITTQDFVLNAPAGAEVTDVNITVDLDHTWSADLDAILIAPNGAQVDLAMDLCGSVDDWENVTFDDEAPIAAANACSGVAPALSGLLQPAGNLSDLDGLDPTGTWTLQITDDAGGDAGTLQFTSLDIAYFVQLPYAPSASDGCGEVTLTYEDNEFGEACDGLTIERLWTATDESGNTATCLQTISIEPQTLDGLEFPDAFIGACGDSEHPGNTGWPTLNGMEIQDFFCNIFIGWEDVAIPGCGGGAKFQREWTVLDWCTLELVTGTQLIKLTDDQPPVLDCPEDVTVNTDPWFCLGTINLQEPDAFDACGTPFTLTPTVSAGTLVPFGSFYRVEDLPLGTHTVTWYAEDECGNSDECSYTITVVDEIPPVPLCDEHTVVSLTEDGAVQHGLTKIPAGVFDDGSYDNCSDITLKARRVTSCIDFDWIGPNGEYPDSDGIVNQLDRGQTFRDLVPFACCDIGNPVMVELRVTDEAGNVNTCMVEVEVQDKISPFLECPPDVVVSCEFWFEVQETGGFVDQEADPLSQVFGRVLDAYSYDESERAPVIIDDPGRPTSPGHPDYLPQPYQWGYDGWADDNCSVEITVRVRVFDDCSGDLPGAPPHPYATRLVERTFRARDASNNSRTCVQRIWVADFTPFYISDQTCVNADPNDGVIWPCDVEYSTCPEEIPVDYPTVFDDNCTLIGVTYEDDVFEFIDGACRKILRTWTIIDWCQYDAETGAGLWQHVQVIKVLDSSGSAFTDCPAGPVTMCVEDEEVYLPANNQVFLGENNPNASSCSAHVNLSHVVTETCSDYVIYDVKLFPNNGSEYIQVVSDAQAEVDSANNATLTFSSEFASLPSNHPIRRYGIPYNDPVCSNWPLPGGEKDYHRLLWTVEDGCGNLNTCEYLFRLEDCKKPSPVCVGLSSVVMPNSGEVTIWAADFNASSFDDCTPANDLLYSFSGTQYVPSMTFDCASIEENGSPSFIVEIWVADGGNDQDCDGFRPPLGIEWEERNKDFCTTFIVIDDNDGTCGGSGSVGGVIQTEEYETVEGVIVDLTDPSGSSAQYFTTQDDGWYYFFNPLLIMDHTIEPERNDDHKNGVSTLDLVRIQQHLLGINPFASPYKLIAADANNSQSVSAIDLVEIRKLILGVYLEYPNNKSWRFVDAAFDFADVYNPWPFAETITLGNGMSMNEDFVGVKIGDVNGTVAANAQSIETRNGLGRLEFRIEDQQVKAGQHVTVPVIASDFTDIFGYQFTLRTQGLELLDIIPGSLEVSRDYIGVHQGAMTMSWHAAAATTVDDNEILFTLSFAAEQSSQLSQMLSIGSRITTAEAYTSASLEGHGVMDVTLTVGDVPVPQDDISFALYQNTPNPFGQRTSISFDLPEEMEVVLTILDVTGRVVQEVKGTYTAGHHQVDINLKEQSNGVMYYRLNAGDFSATKKMVRLE